MKNKRLKYIDVVKGIAIILVVLGHRSFSEKVVQAIYLFHMPLFFIVSGYLDTMSVSTLKDIKTIAKKKISGLIYPYFILGSIIIIYNTISQLMQIHRIDIIKLGKRLIALLYGNFIWENNIDYIGTLWFLPALFCASIIANICYVWSKGERKLLLLFEVILSILGMTSSMLYRKFQIRLPWCLDVAFIGAVFYLLGYQYKQFCINKDRKIQYGVFNIILGFVVGIFNIYYMKKSEIELLRPDMLRMNYGFILFFIIGAFLITVGMLTIIELVCRQKELYIMQRFGQLSLMIMATHLYVFQILDIILGRIGINRWLISFPICIIISFIIAEITDRYLGFLIHFRKVENKKYYKKKER